jgi:hypothetical protein
MNDIFARVWYTPAFSSVLENRRESLIIAGIGVAHFGLRFAGLPGWNCPILAATGVPCPGCGLTRAMIEFIRGDFVQSFHTHAFAPIFLLVMVVIGVTLVLPEAQRSSVLAWISNLETRNGITAWVLVSLMLYWAFRLIA